jgi:hypothetical protein
MREAKNGAAALLGAPFSESGDSRHMHAACQVAHDSTARLSRPHSYAPLKVEFESHQSDRHAFVLLVEPRIEVTLSFMHACAKAVSWLDHESVPLCQ